MLNRGHTPLPTLPLKGGGKFAFESSPPLRGRVREGGAARSLHPGAP